MRGKKINKKINKKKRVRGSSSTKIGGGYVHADWTSLEGVSTVRNQGEKMWRRMLELSHLPFFFFNFSLSLSTSHPTKKRDGRKTSLLMLICLLIIMHACIEIEWLRQQPQQPLQTKNTHHNEKQQHYEIQGRAGGKKERGKKRSGKESNKKAIAARALSLSLS